MRTVCKKLKNTNTFGREMGITPILFKVFNTEPGIRVFWHVKKQLDSLSLIWLM